MNAHALTVVYGTLEPAEPSVEEWIEYCAVVSLAWDALDVSVRRAEPGVPTAAL